MMKRDLIEITTSMLGGAGIGAVLMYLMDPQSGQYRREHIIDRAADAMSSTRHAVEDAGSGVSSSLGHALSHLTHRARGAGEGLSDYVADAGESARGIGRRLSRRARHYMPSASDYESESSMGTGATVTLTALGALALGAGLMYVMDPTSGRRRRALMRDKATRYAHETTDALSGKAEDLSNRARGLYYKGRKRVSRMMPGQGTQGGNSGRPLGAVEEHGQRTVPSQVSGT